jgi:N-acyl-L-homoserine lactone synthetase
MNRALLDAKIFLIMTYLKIMGFEFYLATDEDDLKKIFSLRYWVYLQEGFIKENVCIGDQWKDKYDDHSVNFLAKNRKGEVIGAIRLTVHSDIGFPIENYFNLPDQDVSMAHIVEATRLVVKKDYRGSKRLVLFGLGAVAYKYSITRGIQYWYGTLPEKLAKSFRHFGLEFIKIQEKEPTDRNLQQRQEIAGYFSQKKLEPYICNLNKIKF